MRKQKNKLPKSIRKNIELAEAFDAGIRAGLKEDAETVVKTKAGMAVPKSREEALDKWQRRVKRIHWDNLYFKLAEMNECTDEHLKAFDALPYKNKFVFTIHPRPDIRCAIHYPGYEQQGYISDDTTFFSRGLNLRRFANGMLWK